MIVATTNDLAGHRVVRQLGVVRGITVRSRNVISDAIGGVQSMIGGKVGANVKLAEAARQEAYDDLIAHAQAKLAKKGADLIVANDVSGDVMGGDRNLVHLVSAAGVETLPEGPKDEVARRLATHIAERLNG